MRGPPRYTPRIPRLWFDGQQPLFTMLGFHSNNEDPSLSERLLASSSHSYIFTLVWDNSIFRLQSDWAGRHSPLSAIQNIG